MTQSSCSCLSVCVCVRGCLSWAVVSAFLHSWMSRNPLLFLLWNEWSGSGSIILCPVKCNDSGCRRLAQNAHVNSTPWTLEYSNTIQPGIYYLGWVVYKINGGSRQMTQLTPLSHAPIWGINTAGPSWSHSERETVWTSMQLLRSSIHRTLWAFDAKPRPR